MGKRGLSPQPEWSTAARRCRPLAYLRTPLHGVGVVRLPGEVAHSRSAEQGSSRPAS
jgi:hypothetical protein